MSQLERHQSGDWRVTVYQDDDSESLRGWGTNLGTFITWDRDFLSPDDNPFDSPEDFVEWWASLEADERYVLLNVHRCEHGGVEYRASKPGEGNPFGNGLYARWDSGQVGFIFSTPESIEATGCPLDEIENGLRGEVSVYSHWANGEVYGYLIERAKTCDECGHTEWEDLGACWGYIESIPLSDVTPDDGQLPEDLLEMLRDSYYFE